jgi:hypothetical protein
LPDFLRNLIFGKAGGVATEIIDTLLVRVDEALKRRGCCSACPSS